MYLCTFRHFLNSIIGMFNQNRSKSIDTTSEKQGYFNAKQKRPSTTVHFKNSGLLNVKILFKCRRSTNADFTHHGFKFFKKKTLIFKYLFNFKKDQPIHPEQKAFRVFLLNFTILIFIKKLGSNKNKKCHYHLIIKV